MQEWFGAIAPNPGSWSISIALFNYLLFPLLLLLPRFPRCLSPLALVAGAVIVECFATERLPRGVIEFIMGCAAYNIAARYNYKGSPTFFGLTFFLPFIAAGFIGREFPGISALCFATTMLLMSGSARDPFRDFCASRPMVFIGRISYSIFLLQWFIWIDWKHGIATTPFFAAHPFLMAASAAMSVIACAVPSFYLFERPCRLFLRRAVANEQLTAKSAGALEFTHRR